MIMYILNKPTLSGQEFVTRLLDGANIPFDPANVDFQEYQKWVAEGNTPLPADEITT